MCEHRYQSIIDRESREIEKCIANCRTFIDEHYPLKPNQTAAINQLTHTIVSSVQPGNANFRFYVDNAFRKAEGGTLFDSSTDYHSLLVQIAALKQAQEALGIDLFDITTELDLLALHEQAQGDKLHQFGESIDNQPDKQLEYFTSALTHHRLSTQLNSARTDISERRSRIVALQEDQ